MSFPLICLGQQRWELIQMFVPTSVFAQNSGSQMGRDTSWRDSGTSWLESTGPIISISLPKPSQEWVREVLGWIKKNTRLTARSSREPDGPNRFRERSWWAINETHQDTWDKLQCWKVLPCGLVPTLAGQKAWLFLAKHYSLEALTTNTLSPSVVWFLIQPEDLRLRSQT